MTEPPETQIFPSLDPALTAARLYLTEREENASHLRTFSSALSAFRQPRSAIVEEVRRQAEFLHNAQTLSAEAAAEFRVKLEQYALTYAERLFVNLATIFGEEAVGRVERLEKLRDAIRIERARARMGGI